MPNYTEYLNLEKPLQDEQYNVDVFNRNSDKIDEFARTTPSLALSANVLTNGSKINGVNFKGNKNIVTGLGLYSNEVEYNNGNVVYLYNSENEFKVYKSLQNENIGNNPIISSTFWQEVEIGGGKGVAREIGEIVISSIPIIDSGLHLLDGTRLFGDGIYADFVNYIKDLYEENPNANYFTTEQNWQASITLSGSCGKYVYDSNLHSVRLPKIGNSLIQGTTIINELGELIEAGLPPITHSHSGVTSTAGEHNHTRGTMDITGSFFGENSSQKYAYSGAFYASGSNNGKGIGSTDSDNKKTSFQASRSWTGETSVDGSHVHNYITNENTPVNDIYGNSNTVQPQTIKQFIYVVVAQTQKTNIQINIDNIATDLNNKVNTDLSNITWSDDMKQIVYDLIEDGLTKEAATSEIIGMVKPDNVTIQVDDYGVISTVFIPSNYYTRSEIDSLISTVYTYKGTVNTYSELPSDDVNIGDVYQTLDTGNSYVWDGTNWNTLSTTIDLQPYALNDYVNELIQQKETQIANLSSYIMELQRRIEALELIISGGNA